MRRVLPCYLSFLALGFPSPTIADDWPRTRAERSDYTETSTIEDVSGFLRSLQAKGAPIEFREIGRSAGGKPILLAVMARPGPIAPSAGRMSDKVIVYVQANIHGGEVEGKEAAQMLLRDIAMDREKAASLLDRLIVLVCPVYNVDGNEALGDGATLRSSQDGPARVGRRPNAEGIDLNRDAIKAQAPETRAVLEHVYRAWEPDVVLDLHTTNGTRHGYMLTYSPPLNPNTDPGVQSLARDELLAVARARLGRERDWALFDYGNVESRAGRQGWYTFGQEGRYVSNYVGLRNRIGILSEAASFQPFRLRVEATLAFVRGVLDESARRAVAIKEQIRAADRNVVLWGDRPSGAEPLGVRFDFSERPDPEPIPLEARPIGDKIDHRKAPAPESLKPTPLPVFDRFRATRKAAWPAGYLLPSKANVAAALLREHGLQVERLRDPLKVSAQVFVITERVTGRQAFQGGRLTRLEGVFETRDVEAAAGSFLARTAQPLGRLAFHLLEPESLDGIAAWGYLDGINDAPGVFSVLKLMVVPKVQTEPLP